MCARERAGVHVRAWVCVRAFVSCVRVCARACLRMCMCACVCLYVCCGVGTGSVTPHHTHTHTHTPNQELPMQSHLPRCYNNNTELYGILSF